MITTELAYQLTTLRLRATRAQLLLDLAGKCADADLADVLAFAARLGDRTAADSLGAFRTAQAEQLQAAQAELDRLPGPDEVER